MPTQVRAADPILPLRADVRVFMRDLPGRIPNSGSENILLDDVEFSDAEIDTATRMMVSRFNSIRPPITPIVARQIPLDIAVLGTAFFLMGAESFRQLRNQSSVPDGETSLGIDDKFQGYMAYRKTLLEEFLTQATDWKVMKNMAACWGGVNSAFAYLW